MPVEYVGERPELNPDSPQRYLRRLDGLYQAAQSIRPHSRELAQFLLPRHARFDKNERWSSGSKRGHKDIINNTGTRALRTFQAGIAEFTNPSRPWLRMATRYPELNQKQAVREWLSKLARTMLEVLSRSNVYNGLSGMYLNLGCFGIGALGLEKHPKDVIHGVPMAVGSFYIATDNSNRVNTLYRETTLTVEQMVTRFGMEKCSASVQAMYKSGQLDTFVGVLHAVEPNDKMVPGNLDNSGKRFRSEWIEFAGASAPNKNYDRAWITTFLERGGFSNFPALVPRWDTIENDPYGSDSPAMEALGDIRSLQALERARALQMEKIGIPSLTGPSVLSANEINLLPGGYTPSDNPGANNGIRPLHEINPRSIFMATELERLEQRIDAAFYADLFLSLTRMPNDGKATAREIEERHSEKIRQLVTVIPRIEDEALDPLVTILFDFMVEAGLVQPPPQSQGHEIMPEFISLLAQELKALAAGNLERLMILASQLTEIQPDALDKINFDRLVDNYGEMSGVDPSIIRSDEEAASLREQRREQQMATAEQGKMLRDAAGSAKSLSQTDPNAGALRLVRDAAQAA